MRDNVTSRLEAYQTDTARPLTYGHLMGKASAYLRERNKLYRKELGDPVLKVAGEKLSLQDILVGRTLQDSLYTRVGQNVRVYALALQLAAEVEGISLSCLDTDPHYTRGAQALQEVF